VASPGSVDVEGWVLGLAGALNHYVNGSILYAFTQADWTRRGARGALRSAAPSAARTGSESTHDLVASVEATLPITATRVAAAYRVNNAFSAPAADRLDPLVDGRFNIEIRQHLPFQPFRHGELNLLVAARTLLRDFDANGAFYDELLTVAPPLRLTCGLQMRF
jgi:hypothetical protein